MLEPKVNTVESKGPFVLVFTSNTNAGQVARVSLGVTFDVTSAGKLN